MPSGCMCKILLLTVGSCSPLLTSHWGFPCLGGDRRQEALAEQMHIPDFTHSKLDDAPSSFLFPSPLIFAFTDELLSCVINLQVLARWDSFILKKH